MADYGNDPKQQRKSPRQSRSIALVEAIMDATVRILPKAGWGGLSTKKVAEVAGVSIGSLYQYFPNKEALVSSVIDFAMKANRDRFTKYIETNPEATLEEAVTSIIELTLELFIDDLEEIRAIYKRAPELGKMQVLTEVRRLTAEQLAIELRTRRPELAERQAHLITFIAVNAAMGVVQSIIYDEKVTYTREELERELKRMLIPFFITSSSERV